MARGKVGGKPREGSAVSSTLALPAAATNVDVQTQRELSREMTSRRVRQSDTVGRRRFGANTDMISIASAIENANCGLMADMSDLANEILSLDPHLASCASKRLGSLQAADWDVMPPPGITGTDRPWAAKIATETKRMLENISIADAIFDLSWSLYHGRSALEMNWASGAWGMKMAPYSYDYIAPRRIAFGGERELRVVDPYYARAFDSSVGVSVEETPGKFLFWKPRLFGELQEREGLALRSFYWCFFKRFGWRLGMRYTELFAIPWRIMELDAENPANEPSIEDARRQIDELSGDTSAVMPAGTSLKIEWPGESSGELFSKNHEFCNAETSKLWLGNTSTTQQGEGNRAEGIIGKGEQDIIFQRDGNGASRRVDPLIRTFVRLNFGDGAIHLVPKFQIRTAPQRDRDKEGARAKLAMSMGLTIAESDLREMFGIRAPAPDEKFFRMGAGGVDAMGNPTPGAVEIVDPTKPAKEEREPTAERAEDDVEDQGVDGQAAAAVKDALGLSRGYAASAVCCAAQAGLTVPPSAVYGSPEVLVERGVKEGARASSAWAASLASAVDGLSDAVSIRRAIDATQLDVEAFAKAVERRLVHGAMLGALDADWEAENDRVVKPPAFAISNDGSGREIEEPEPMRLARYGIDPTGGIKLQGGVKDFAASPFQEAIRIFKQRNVVTRRAFDRLAAQAKQRAFTVANMASRDVIGVVKDELTKALEEGDDLRRFSARLAERTETAGWVASNPSHVENVFRTNTMGAYARGREEQMTQPSVLAARPYWQIMGPDDSRKRPAHKRALGKVLHNTDGFWKRAPLPWGFMCFVPETVVEGQFVGASRALYEGKFVELTTKEGRRLTVTANHPVLAAHGFSAAETIRVGDELVCYAAEKDRARARGAEHDDHERKVTAENVFDALARTSNSSTATAAGDDFHGEAKSFIGEVEVVGSYGMLWSEPQPALTAGTSQSDLVPTDSTTARPCAMSELAVTHDPATSGNMRGGDLSGTLAGAHAGPLEPLRIGPAADLDTVIDESISEARVRDAKLSSELREAGSGSVFLDRVVEVREFFARRHVHDLETVGGWLVADGIIASNCRDRKVSRSAADVERLGLEVVSGASLSGLPDEGWDGPGGF